jgi:hypothetical protein
MKKDALLYLGLRHSKELSQFEQTKNAITPNKGK